MSKICKRFIISYSYFVAGTSSRARTRWGKERGGSKERRDNRKGGEERGRKGEGRWKERGEGKGKLNTFFITRCPKTYLRQISAPKSFCFLYFW